MVCVCGLGGGQVNASPTPTPTFETQNFEAPIFSYNLLSNITICFGSEKELIKLEGKAGKQNSKYWNMKYAKI